MSDEMLKERAIRLFTFLSEFSELGFKKIRTIDSYEQVVWLSDISQEKSGSLFMPESASRLKNPKDVWFTLDKPKEKEPGGGKVYDDLFALYQHQQRLGESYEVVLGLGFLTWETPAGYVVKRHLLTAQTQLNFDPDEGRIDVEPSSDGANISLEQDMLDVGEQPPLAANTLINKLIGDLEENIANKEAIDCILQTWIDSCPNNLGYHNQIARHGDSSSAPKISFAPALILRRRTERNFVRAFGEIIEQLKNSSAVSIPKSIENLVKEPSKDLLDSTSEKGETPPGFIYFPLPANDEQIEIARQLEKKDAILVQGPPGTGKSHTIANLICHLLASGQRVLVTSHASRALAVLREKIPPEVAALCVIALSDDAMSLNALEASVNGITEKRNTWNAAHNQKEIDLLQKELDTALAYEKKLLANLRTIRESEVKKHGKKFGYDGTLKEIAIKIRQEEEEYSWIGAVHKDRHEYPLRNAEAQELLNLLRQFDMEKDRELEQYFVSPKVLPSASEFSSLVRVEHDAREKCEAFERIRQHKNYAALEKAREIQRLQLRYTIDNILRKINAAAQAGENSAWGKDAALDILKGNDLTYQELCRLTQTLLDKMGNDAEIADKMTVAGLENVDKKNALTHAQDLLAHLRGGGKLGFWLFRPQMVKDSMYLIKNTKIDGQLCDNIEALKKLVKWLEINDCLETLGQKWAPYAKKAVSTLFSVQKTEYKRRLEVLSECLELQNDVAEARGVIQFIPDFAEPSWADEEALAAIIEIIDAANARHNLLQKQKSVEAILDDIKMRLADKPEIRQAAETLSQAITERDYLAYAKYLQKARELEHLDMQINQRNNLFTRLERAAPLAAATLKADLHNALWDERLAKFQNAWNWAKADAWLKTVADLSEDNHLREQAEQLRGHIQQITAKLAAAKAWQFCLTKLTEHESSHLKAWQLSMKRIGRGTGAKAGAYRKEARFHLEECRSAIPAWIMPIYRIVETIAMKPGIFDVVIIDEASQSGPEALLLQYIAKKIVVVGDSKQISPSFIGISKEDTDLLRERLIPDLPFADVLGVENSFFDQAFIRYKGQICLREHFRCMPEIIQFSNDLCYTDTPLIPLKQYGAGRLAPTVGSVYIDDGCQKGKSPRVTNPPEAQAIASYIAACCADKKYDGKTFGVISLLGEEQGKLINRLLLAQIGSQEIEKRNLLCGDAYAFQGDERDVMILSMVSAPGEGHKIGILTVADAQKRFNVAASRAKEQLLLFHSAALNELNPLCLRYRLLKYCLDPRIEMTATDYSFFSRLKELARADRRQNNMPPHPFDNWFQVDVFLDIFVKKYRVIPKFNVAGHYLDMVVEGLQGRLAIACYADTWQGALEYEKDLAKERQLERSGYGIWRIRAGVYYRDPQAALGSLWKVLDEMRIFPENS